MKKKIAVLMLLIFVLGLFNYTFMGSRFLATIMGIENFLRTEGIAPYYISLCIVIVVQILFNVVGCLLIKNELKGRHIKNLIVTALLSIMMSLSIFSICSSDLQENYYKSSPVVDLYFEADYKSDFKTIKRDELPIDINGECRRGDFIKIDCTKDIKWQNITDKKTIWLSLQQLRTYSYVIG